MIYALIDSTSRKLVTLPMPVTMINEDEPHTATAIDYSVPKHANSSGRVRVEVKRLDGTLMYEQSFFPHVFGLKIVELNDDENDDASDDVDVMHNDITETYDRHIEAIRDAIDEQRNHITSLLVDIHKNTSESEYKDRLESDLHNAFFTLKEVQTSMRNLAAFARMSAE